MQITAALVWTVAATIACLILFALAPQLDLAASRHFFVSGHFIAAATPAGDAARRVFYFAPFVVFGAMLCAYVARRLNFLRQGPDNRAIVFLAASLALGPGLLINGVLKEHAHRPRPEQTEEFGGPWRFRPYDRLDGQCVSNCSFASGEAATSAWTLAPALLAPPAWRAAAIGASLLLTFATALLRMAFGGHYLSDVSLAALFTFVIVLALYRWYRRADDV